MRRQATRHSETVRKQVFLAHDQGGRIQRSQLETMAMSDGVRRASLNAVSAEDAAVVVDVIDLRIALGARDADLGGVLGRLDVDTVRGARRRAQETCYALFQAVLVALQH